MKYVLITGSSGGMGLSTCKKFLSQGYFVFGLDINEPNIELGDNFKFIKTNLRDESSIISAFNIVKDITNELSSLIHMAGIYDLNSLVEMSEDDFTKIFDINVFAVYRINKIFLPLIKQKGKIIITTSELGPLDPLPFTGIYGISKSTLEKYAYSLRMELQLLDKYVVIIRPGAVDTGLLDISTTKIEKFAKTTKLYTYNATKFFDITNKVESKKISPEKIADIAYKIDNKRKPKYVYKINRNKGLLILNFLPDRLQNYIIKKILNNK